ncbi:MAG: macro domain-containing protein [Acidimicrobiia bacterium]|nr:MAG: macro domain-containing protein [Acidimicrobiia bacterium]
MTSESHSIVTVVEGDITGQDVDVIVNAANAKLLHGGGVAAAISRAGGPVIDEESRAWVAANGPVGPGVAAVTSGGDLAAGHVVHVVGPVFVPGGDNEDRLRRAVAAALDAALVLEVSSVALPAISAGIYGYPPEQATLVIASEVVAWLASHPESFTEVRLVAFTADTASAFAAALRTLGS